MKSKTLTGTEAVVLKSDMTPGSFSVRVAPQEYRALKVAVANRVLTGHESLSVSELVREIVFDHPEIKAALAQVLAGDQPPDVED
jgi:hypothetical protein